MRLSEIQEKIVKTDKKKVHVISAAASGKTSLVVNRIKYLLDKGVNPEKIVAITFTNNAANEMYERLGRPDGLFIGTVHSYCNYLLRSEGIDTSEYLVDEKFDGLFELFKKNYQCLRPIEHLIVDEFQDSSPEQIDFFKFLVPDNYMYCYDPRQAIYNFNKADINKVFLTQNEPGVTIYEMNENYRNACNILNFAKNILLNLGSEYRDNSITMRKENGFIEHTHWSYHNIVDYFLYEVKPENYKDWFILGRRNQELHILGAMLDKEGIPYTNFKQGSLTREEIEKEVNSNKIKLLTIHSAKGLESPNVLVINVGAYYSDEERRVYYVAATRAKNYLVWNRMKNKQKKKKVEKPKVEVKMIDWE